MFPCLPPVLPDAPRRQEPVPAATVVWAAVPRTEVGGFSFDGRTVVGTSGDQACAWEVPTDAAETTDGAGGRLWTAVATSGARAVSADGSVFGGTAFPSRREAVGGRAFYGGIPDVARLRMAPYANTGGVQGISGDGRIAVGTAAMRVWTDVETPTHLRQHSRGEAVRWEVGGDDRATPENIGAGWGSCAYGISRDGRVIVGWTNATGRGFWWTRETGAESLGDLDGGGTDTWGRAVSGDGKVVVGRAAGKRGTEAFRWTEETGMQGLGDLPGAIFSSEAYGISDDGTLVVGRGNGPRVGESSQGDRAFLWSAEVGMQDLQGLLSAQGKIGDGLPKRFERWRLRDAVGVRRVGERGLQVAGTAIDAGGGRVPYVATFTLPSDESR